MNSILLDARNIKMRALKNLGTFSTTCMIKQAEEIFKNYASMNAVDSCAYPELEQLVEKCGKFLLKLFQAPDPKQYSFFPTSGSSEAIFLSLLLMKHHWLSKRKSEGKPNFIIGPTSHVAFFSAAKSLDIDIRILPFHQNSFIYDETKIYNIIDTNTIGLCCTLGATSTLVMDNVENINKVLSEYYQSAGHFIPIHVDAASGGFIAPFYYPHLNWNFSLTHVKAINVSSHKFGLVYPSLGWLFMDNAYCLSELAHESSYLGKTFKRFPLQFSHSAAQIAAQYYNIEHLGENGYQHITQKLYQNLNLLVSKMKALERFHFITPNDLPCVPGVIFNLSRGNQQQIIQLRDFLSERGWHLPIFESVYSSDNLPAARIMVRYGFNETLINELIHDLNAFFNSRR
ncbi:MAG: aminotransferase class V-fold PLP-dependent enzyme [Gammaproteobacteria bacterium]|nr:aminotransferase class V-fold PLP-dependent enzyme [Gammaproteobacteria bacterium]